MINVWNILPITFRRKYIFVLFTRLLANVHFELVNVNEMFRNFVKLCMCIGARIRHSINGHISISKSIVQPESRTKLNTDPSQSQCPASHHMTFRIQSGVPQISRNRWQNSGLYWNRNAKTNSRASPSFAHTWK